MSKTLGLVVNPDKPEAFDLATKLVKRIEASGARVLVESPAPNSLGQWSAALSEVVKQSDAIVVLGGDGSLLRVARVAAPAGVPILGVQYGRYGFVMETEPEDAPAAVDKLLSGDFYYSERMMLQAELPCREEQPFCHLALNDIVVTRGPMSRLLRLKVTVGKQEVVKYSADGIIVATPTGSTAYSLSAGGPVVHPNVDVVILTPIAAHTLNSRTLVLPASESIEIAIEGEGLEAYVTVDGQENHEISDGEMVKISRSPYPTQLVETSKSAFYHQLESRLGFGERYAR